VRLTQGWQSAYHPGMKAEIHFTLKNILSVVIVICAIGLAVIPLAVSADHLVWARWQCAIIALAVIAICAVFWQASLQSRDDHKAQDREKVRDETLADIMLALKKLTGSNNKAEVLAGSMEVAELERPPRAVNGASTDPETDVIDGTVYRLALNPRTPAWDLLKGVYRMRGEEPHVPCDVLVNMYLVNTSKTATAYIRDLELSADIKGTRVTLKCQTDFRAEDFNDQQWEYGIKKLEKGKFDDTEPLRQLFSAMPITLGPKQPITGWARFLAEDINPDDITAKSWQLCVIDSLGNKHQINKAEPDGGDDGEIGLRRAG
jgi:hypothetical protein